MIRFTLKFFKLGKGVAVVCGKTSLFLLFSFTFFIFDCCFNCCVGEFFPSFLLFFNLTFSIISSIAGLLIPPLFCCCCLNFDGGAPLLESLAIGCCSIACWNVVVCDIFIDVEIEDEDEEEGEDEELFLDCDCCCIPPPPPSLCGFIFKTIFAFLFSKSSVDDWFDNFLISFSLIFEFLFFVFNSVAGFIVVTEGCRCILFLFSSSLDSVRNSF